MACKIFKTSGKIGSFISVKLLRERRLRAYPETVFDGENGQSWVLVKSFVSFVAALRREEMTKRGSSSGHLQAKGWFLDRLLKKAGSHHCLAGNRDSCNGLPLCLNKHINIRQNPGIHGNFFFPATGSKGI
jgi:hypothetical protein